MRIVGFGTWEGDRHPRARVLLAGLAAHGHRVEEATAPLELTTAERVAMLRHPWLLYRLALRLASRWGRLIVRRTTLGRPDAVLVGHLGQFDILLARLLFPRSTRVLDLLVIGSDTASDRGAGGLRGRLAGVLDRLACRAADVVVVDTDEDAALVPAESRAKAVVAPVGASAAWRDARRPPSDAADAPLRVIFYGAYTPLQGTPVLGAALARLRGLLADGSLQVTLVGDGQDRAACTRAAGDAAALVTWLDWVDPSELPALVASHDVCLGILGTTPKAGRVVPHKVFEGAMAGCAIVTSDTAPQRRSLGDAGVFVPPGDAEALADALRALTRDPAEVARLRAAAAAHADRHHSPAAVAQPLHLALTRESPMPGTPPPLAPRAWLRWDVVDRMLRRLRPTTVLEIGCGQGAFGARIAPRAAYLGLEPDPLSYAVARDRITPAGGEVLPVLTDRLPSGRTFDLVLACEVLEHLEDDAAALADWVRFVRPGGHLLLSVSADPARFGPMDEVAGHFRRYTAEGLTALVRDAGLTDVRTVTYGWPLGYALEAVRNRVDHRRTDTAPDASMAEHTAASGRHVQPGRRLTGLVTRVGTLPFRGLQRLRPRAGTGLVLQARRPD